MKKIILAGSLLMSSTLSLAGEDTGFYLAPSIGQATYDISQSDVDDLALAAYEAAGVTVIDAESSLDDTGTPWSLVGGWRFSEYVAAEIGYVDLGKAQYEAEGTVFVPGLGVFDSSFDADISAKGPTAAVAAFWPLGEHFDLHGRAGILFAKTKIDLGASIEGERESTSLDASSRDPFFGLGASYHFTDRVAATLDYTLYKDVGDEDETGEGDVDAFTLGLIFNF